MSLAAPTTSIFSHHPCYAKIGAMDIWVCNYIAYKNFKLILCWIWSITGEVIGWTRWMKGIMQWLNIRHWYRFIALDIVTLENFLGGAVIVGNFFLWGGFGLGFGLSIFLLIKFSTEKTLLSTVNLSCGGNRKRRDGSKERKERRKNEEAWEDFSHLVICVEFLETLDRKQSGITCGILFFYFFIFYNYGGSSRREEVVEIVVNSWWSRERFHLVSIGEEEK